MEDQELVKEGRILALKMITEAYLISKENNQTDKMFPKNNPESWKHLRDEEIYVLHNWLIEEYDRAGLNLKELIEATGEQIVPGKLSQFELKELLVRADQVLQLISVVKDYVDAKNN